MTWLVAASAPFLEVHLGNGEMFFREKKAKQQFPNLMGENKEIQHTPLSPLPSSLVSCFLQKFSFEKENMWGVLLPASVFEASDKARVPLCLEHIKLGQHHPGIGQGPMVPAWNPCQAVGLSHRLCLCLSPTCLHSSHIPAVTWQIRPECACPHLVSLGALAVQQEAWTRHGEAIRVGERKCWVVRWNSTKTTFFFFPELCWAFLVCKYPKMTGGQHGTCWTPVLSLYFMHGTLLTEMEVLPPMILPLFGSRNPIFDWCSYILWFTQILRGWARLEDKVEGLRSPFALL